MAPRVWATALAILLALGGGLGAWWAQAGLKVEAERQASLDVNLLLVPPPIMVKTLAAGSEALAADGLWLSFLQYYGDRVVKDHRVHNMAPMLHLITDLDPRFYYAYFLGAWALGDSGDPKEGVALLRKAAGHNPEDWRYPYLEGFLQFLFLKDYPAAVAALEHAGKLPGAERFCWTLAARIRQKMGQDQDALSIWRQLADHATDAFTRSIAKRNVERIEAELRGTRPRAFRVEAPASPAVAPEAAASALGATPGVHSGPAPEGRP